MPRLCSALADRFECARQRVVRAYLVVAISADQQQVTDVLLSQETFDQVESGDVEPLQIVKKQC